MKRNFKKALLVGLGAIGLVIIGVIGYVKFFLPDVAAAPYLEVDASPERVERGKYLATNVAICMDCHSTRDWSKFSGPLVEGSLGMGGEYFGPEMGFPGTFYAKNLTPVNLGDWTDGEIFRAITTGVKRNGEVIFPVMPYENYRKMDKQDIYDIIAYLRTLEPIENKIPTSEADFPMNLILNTIPVEAEFTSRPHKSDQLKYGEYLTTAASCIVCHTPASKGKLDLQMAYAGGREFQMPAGMLRSMNITPDKKTGIGNWTQQDFVRRFKAYSQEEAVSSVKKEDYNTIMPWTMYAEMDEEDLAAIYVYLQSLEPINNEVVFWEK